jgi:hypothetical protein
MNKSILALSLLLAPLAANAGVTVQWVSPEEFRDAYYTSSKTEKSRQIILDDLQKFIVEQASQYLKEGENLEIRVTNVDMAGEFEPWTDNPDVRSIRSPYFAYIAFGYRLTGADGKVIKENDNVRLTNHLLTPPNLPDRDEMEPYLRQTLRDWLRLNLR